MTTMMITMSKTTTSNGMTTEMAKIASDGLVDVDLKTKTKHVRKFK